MNDRFKFRVWDIKQQKYRQRTHHEADTCINCLSGKVLFGEGIEIYGEEDDKDVTLEQCTGLKDKNGRFIYEGDICIPAKDMADKAGEVYRAESGAYFIKGKMKNGMEYDFGIYWHHYMYEIIGNIHENKELLDE